MGRSVLVYGIYVDQTERLRAEAALRESEEKFRSLAEQSLQGIFVLKRGRVAYANQMMAEITGYDLADFLGFDQQALERIIHPADRTFVVAAANGFEIGDGKVSPQIRVSAHHEIGRGEVGAAADPDRAIRW